MHKENKNHNKMKHILKQNEEQQVHLMKLSTHVLSINLKAFKGTKSVHFQSFCNIKWWSK